MNEPIYSKLYSYTSGVTDFEKKEIQNFLDNGINRVSRSAYKNPLWVVDKKGVYE